MNFRRCTNIRTDSTMTRAASVESLSSSATTTASESASRLADRTSRLRPAKGTGSASAARTTTSPGEPSASDAIATRKAIRELETPVVDAMGTGLAHHATTATSLGGRNVRSAAQRTRTPAALAVGEDEAVEVELEEAVA